MLAAASTRRGRRFGLLLVATLAIPPLFGGCASMAKGRALRFDERANEAWRAGDPAQALELCLQAVGTDPACAEAWVTQAMIALEEARRDDGIDLLREALFHDPANHRARARLATELLRRGDAQEALEECQLAIGTNPDYAATWFVMGLACERLGDGSAAAACYWKGLALEPGAADFFERLRELTPSS